MATSDLHEKKKKNETASDLQSKINTEIALIDMAFKYEKRIGQLEFDVQKCTETINYQHKQLLEWKKKHAVLEKHFNEVAKETLKKTMQSNNVSTIDISIQLFQIVQYFRVKL